MLLTGSSPKSPDPAPTGITQTERREWIYRGTAGLAVALLVSFGYLHTSDVRILLLVAPLLIGACVEAMRLQVVSEKINAIERWLNQGATRAAERDGKFARFFQRPFYRSCLAAWRWSRFIPDAHLRAGARATMLIFICGIAAGLLLLAAYLAFAVVSLVIILFIVALIFGLIALIPSQEGSGSRNVITEHTTDWLGRPKQEHFDTSGNKIGESEYGTDWFGNPKMVHKDADGNFVGESRPDTDWFGNPKTVHTDAEGHVIGESRPETDWLGQPKTVHTDAEGNVVGESRKEADIFGQTQSVRYAK